MSVHQLADQQRLADEAPVRGRWMLSPFGGLLIEPDHAPARDRARPTITRQEFEDLLRLMPSLPPEISRQIMGVDVQDAPAPL